MATPTITKAHKYTSYDFDLKIDSKKLLDKFDARLLSLDEREELKPILLQWEQIAKAKEQDYDNRKSKKIRPTNYVNPFANTLSLIEGFQENLDSEEDLYFGAYDKKTQTLQALSSACHYDTKTFYLLSLATHPNNIRTKCNKERISGAASRLIYEMHNWAKEFNEIKLDCMLLTALKGSRTFYQNIGFQPSLPPQRTTWILPITPDSQGQWLNENQSFLADPTLDAQDKTEESSEEIAP